MMLAPGMSWVCPYIMVRDVEKSLDFYQKVFGFETIEMVKDDEGVACHGEMRYNDMIIMVGLEGKYTDEMKTPKTSGVTSPITLYVYVNEVDKFYQAAVENGAVSVGEPEDTFWGDRCCRLKDPDDYVWCFGSYISK